jgi:hypothetical protein
MFIVSNFGNWVKKRLLHEWTSQTAGLRRIEVPCMLRESLNVVAATDMNTYYHSDTSAEVEAIVRDGFIDHMKHKRSGMRGVYVADAPGTRALPSLNSSLNNP